MSDALTLQVLWISQRWRIELRYLALGNESEQLVGARIGMCLPEPSERNSLKVLRSTFPRLGRCSIRNIFGACARVLQVDIALLKTGVIRGQSLVLKPSEAEQIRRPLYVSSSCES